MSDTSVAERLQVKRGRRLAVIGAPAEVDRLIAVPDDRAEVAAADVALLFAHDLALLDGALADALPQLGAAAILWVAYPKLTSRLAGDLSRDVIRERAPGYGLQTVSQIAIDADWSALRLKRVAS